MLTINMDKRKNSAKEKEIIIEEVKQLFSEYLITNRCRKTPERFAILEMIYRWEGHFDIDELYLGMEKSKFRVSKATIYNTLEILTQCKLVHKHQLGGSSTYEKSYRAEPHHHLVCLQCGEVSEYHFDGIRQLIEETKFPKFKQSQYALYIYGICSKCTRLNGRKKAAETLRRKKAEGKKKIKKLNTHAKIKQTKQTKK